jgi:CRISPR/Cas system-associated endoribonuclease Cas2
MTNLKKLFGTTLVALALAGVGSTALADTTWQKNHPRREQVNNRLANQNKRIKNEVKEGDLTKAQAAKLHTEDRQIRKEERLMASQNGGHITKLEQKTLNQQENKVSKQIGQ